MRSLIFLSSLLLFATVCRSNSTVGGWSKITNLSDRQVQEIASFAVAENNKQLHGVLKLIRVLSGEEQVVSGVNYRLVVETDGRGEPGKYQAVVLVKAWLNSRQLISFQKV